MLSNEALAERRWMGLQYLRSLLEPYGKDVEAAVSPTSISDSEFENIRNAIELAALVSETRDAMLAAVRGSESQTELRAAAALRDLRFIQHALEGAHQRISKCMEEIEALCREVQRVGASRESQAL